MQLGKSNVDALGRSLTAKQFLGWEAYEKVEPFGQDWNNLLVATIVQAIRNVLVTKEENLSKLEDCMLKLADDDPTVRPKIRAPQTFEEQIAIAKLWAESTDWLKAERSPDY